MTDLVGGFVGGVVGGFDLNVYLQQETPTATGADPLAADAGADPLATAAAPVAGPDLTFLGELSWMVDCEFGGCSMGICRNRIFNKRQQQQRQSPIQIFFHVVRIHVSLQQRQQSLTLEQSLQAEVKACCRSCCRPIGEV